jgi:hypothetical protein
MGPLLHGPWSLRRGRAFIGNVTKITLIADSAAVGCLTSDLGLGLDRRDQAASDGLAGEAASIDDSLASSATMVALRLSRRAASVLARIG